jgi:hypothetical protein
VSGGIANSKGAYFYKTTGRIARAKYTSQVEWTAPLSPSSPRYTCIITTYIPTTYLIAYIFD